jgi:hypothetical protein
MPFSHKRPTPTYLVPPFFAVLDMRQSQFVLFSVLISKIPTDNRQLLNMGVTIRD